MECTWKDTSHHIYKRYFGAIAYEWINVLQLRLVITPSNTTSYRIQQGNTKRDEPIFAFYSKLLSVIHVTLHCRHNGRDSVSNHQPHDCLLNRLFRHRSKKTSKLRVTGLCVGNSPGTGEFPHKWPVTRKMFPFDDVIMWKRRDSEDTLAAWRLESSATRLFVQKLVLASTKENIKVCVAGTLWKKSTSDRWIPFTKDQ